MEEMGIGAHWLPCPSWIIKSTFGLENLSVLVLKNSKNINDARSYLHLIQRQNNSGASLVFFRILKKTRDAMFAGASLTPTSSWHWLAPLCSHVAAWMKCHHWILRKRSRTNLNGWHGTLPHFTSTNILNFTTLTLAWAKSNTLIWF